MPPIRPDFDVYLDGNRLIYNKDACSKDDISENFLLELYPVDESDLPEDRRLHGLDNLDFSFFEHTFHRGKRCIARTRSRNMILRAYTLDSTSNRQTAQPNTYGRAKPA